MGISNKLLKGSGRGLLAEKLVPPSLSPGKPQQHSGMSKHSRRLDLLFQAYNVVSYSIEHSLFKLPGYQFNTMVSDYLKPTEMVNREAKITRRFDE